MNVSPIKDYVQPRFPTAQILDEHPELLKLIPKRWQTNPAVLTALAGAAVLLAGLAADAAKPHSPKGVGPTHQTTRPPGLPAPTLFLTESEARRIIIDEGRKAGLQFRADQQTVKVPIESVLEPTRKPEKPLQGMARIVLDGTDSRHGVSYEYVSREDRQELSHRYHRPARSAFQISKVLRQQIAESPKTKVLVIETSVDFTRESAEKQLRSRVVSFIKWLKAEGVI